MSSRFVAAGLAVPRRLAEGGASVLGRIWLLVVLLGIWEVAARLWPSVFIPPLSVVLLQFADDWLGGDPARLFLSDAFWSTVPVSLSRLARGFGIAVVTGIAIGVLLGRSWIADAAFGPVIRFWMSVPNAALLPIALQLFGVGDGFTIALIAFGTVWLIAMHTADGVRGVDPAWLQTARSLRLSPVARYTRVVLPAAAPQILAGIRVGLGFGLILMVVGELYATTSGLGHDVSVFQQTFQYRRMWSAFLLIALVGIAANLALDAVEARLLRWRNRTGLGGA